MQDFLLNPCQPSKRIEIAVLSQIPTLYRLCEPNADFISFF